MAQSTVLRCMRARETAWISGMGSRTAGRAVNRNSAREVRHVRAVWCTAMRTLPAATLIFLSACRVAPPVQVDPPLAPRSAIMLADFRRMDAGTSSQSAPPSCRVTPIEPREGTEAKLITVFPGMTVSGWALSCDRTDRLSFELDDCRNHWRFMGTSLDVASNESVLALAAVAIVPTGQIATTLMIIRQDGTFVEMHGGRDTPSGSESVDPYPVGWCPMFEPAGALDSGDTCALAVWSWNGRNSDALANALLFNGLYTLDLSEETIAATSKPLAQWPRPVLALKLGVRAHAKVELEGLGAAPISESRRRADP